MNKIVGGLFLTLEGGDGVGKSTLCMLSALAVMRLKKGFSVNLIDTDAQKSSLSILDHVKTNILLE